MNELSYSNIGWIDGTGNVLTSVRADANPHFELVPISSIPVLSRIACIPREPQSFWSVVTILYNISLGQRRVTPQFQANFIDRATKTFFTDVYRPSFECSVRPIVMSAALFNYIEMNYWNSEVGIISHLYDEYRHVRASYAYSLLNAIGNGYVPMKACSDIADDIKYRIDGTKRIFDNVASRIQNESDAIAFVDGVAFECCYRDHTAVAKDMKNTKSRKWLLSYAGDADSVSVDAVSFFGKKDISKTIEFGHKRNAFYVIGDNSDETVDIIAKKDCQ